MIVVIDNYDSFTYNLVQYLAELGVSVEVFRNDEVTIAQLEQMAPKGIVLSPGPGTPTDAGICLELIHELGQTTPILGVCLGHQSIVQAYGGNVMRADRLMHGRTSPVVHDGSCIFKGLPSPFTATRYHSLIVQRATLPELLRINAWTAEEEIMGVVHQDRLVWGVQFHPESFLTEHGHALLRNWLRAIDARLVP
ncbi:MAG: aminodeoxychorismate/anthranilate synthase component II [Myxococcota bacterium]